MLPLLTEILGNLVYLCWLQLLGLLLMLLDATSADQRPGNLSYPTDPVKRMGLPASLPPPLGLARFTPRGPIKREQNIVPEFSSAT